MSTQSATLDREPAVRWQTQLLINGKFVDGAGPALDVENPTTEKTLASLHQASPGQLDEAVRAARAAFNSGVWADGEKRKAVLLRIADLMEARKAELGRALILEVGTPAKLVEPLQIGGALALLRHHAQQAPIDRTRDLNAENPGAPGKSIVRYIPVGVVAAITAYNYPLLLMAAKLGPALAAGCTTVLLPSIQTPLSTLMMGDIFREAGVPDGVINIVVGGIEIGRALTEHAEVDKITFTGSVPVGAAVMRQAADTIKGVVLELGGKSAAVVLPGADLNAAAGPLNFRYARNAGQGCSTTTRILVHESQVDEFIALSKAIIDSAVVGDPLDLATDTGPLISKPHRARVEGYVERALAAGGKVVAGGGRPDIAQGWFMNPVLIAGVTNQHEISRDELFGPVAVLLTYKTVDEAVEIANDSHFGLAAAVWGQKDEAIAVAKRINAGTISINGGGPGMRLDAPFGGMKQSGLGREWGTHEGIFEFLEAQHLNWAE